MAVESADDLAAFFSADEFGVTATWSPATEFPSSVDGILTLEFVEIAEGERAGVESRKPVFTCATADVPGNAHGAGLTVDGTAYTVAGIEPSTDGAVTRLILTKAA